MQTAAWGAEGTAPDRSLDDCVTIDDVRAAAATIAPIIRPTPTLSVRGEDLGIAGEMLCKCENLQRMGAFKLRGAANAMCRLDAHDRAHGVITYSSGNHAQAIALSAAELGVPAVIVMPEDAPRVKLERTRAYLERAPRGSEVVLYRPTETAREELGIRIAEERGLRLIPPYDHPHVIAGQGTAGLELLEQAGEPLNELYVCCGGGGLLSGCAVAARAIAPGCRVIGVEPANADDAARSFRDGVLRTVQNPDTIADGARTPFVGRHTFPLILRHVDEILTVTERELAAATLLAMRTLRLVVEPSGALALAGALLAERRGSRRGVRAGIVISGGNLDLSILPRLEAIAAGE